MDDSTERKGIWVVVELDGHRAVVGKVMGKGDELTEAVKNDILGMKRITVNPAFDFFAPLRPIQQRMPNGEIAQGITRDPVVTGNHFTFDSCPVYVNMALATKVFFFDEMKASDRRRYAGYLEHAEETIQQQRLAESGLISGRQEAPPPLRVPTGPGQAMDLSKIIATP